MDWLGAFWTSEIDKVPNQGALIELFGLSWTDLNKGVVPVGGLEPPRLAPPDFESGVSTISPHWHVL